MWLTVLTSGLCKRRKAEHSVIHAHMETICEPLAWAKKKSILTTRLKIACLFICVRCLLLRGVSKPSETTFWSERRVLYFIPRFALRAAKKNASLGLLTPVKRTAQCRLIRISERNFLCSRSRRRELLILEQQLMEFSSWKFLSKKKHNQTAFWLAIVPIMALFFPFFFSLAPWPLRPSFWWKIFWRGFFF